MKTILTLLMLGLILVLIFTPYKYYDSVPIFGGEIIRDCFSTIAEEIENICAISWINMVFIFITFPLVLLLEILLLRSISSKKWKYILIVQGIIGIVATAYMWFLMTFSLFQSNVRLTFVFYFSVLLVGGSSVSSILFGMSKFKSWIQKIKTI